MTTNRHRKRSQRTARFHAAQQRMAATRHQAPPPLEPEELALFDLTDFDPKEQDHDRD